MKKISLRSMLLSFIALALYRVIYELLFRIAETGFVYVCNVNNGKLSDKIFRFWVSTGVNISSIYYYLIGVIIQVLIISPLGVGVISAVNDSLNGNNVRFGDFFRFYRAGYKVSVLTMIPYVIWNMSSHLLNIVQEENVIADLLFNRAAGIIGAVVLIFTVPPIFIFAVRSTGNNVYTYKQCFSEFIQFPVKPVLAAAAMFAAWFIVSMIPVLLIRPLNTVLEILVTIITRFIAIIVYLKISGSSVNSLSTSSAAE